MESRNIAIRGYCDPSGGPTVVERGVRLTSLYDLLKLGLQKL